MEKQEETRKNIVLAKTTQEGHPIFLTYLFVSYFVPFGLFRAAVLLFWPPRGPSSFSIHIWLSSTFQPTKSFNSLKQKLAFYMELVFFLPCFCLNPVLPSIPRLFVMDTHSVSESKHGASVSEQRQWVSFHISGRHWHASGFLSCRKS
jgi:hypothetical protein